MMAEHVGRERHDGVATSWLSLVLVAVFGFLATVYFYYPGFMTWDSTFQFTQVLSRRVENTHPPIMVYVWMLANALVWGPGGMLILQAAAYWTGLAMIATSATRSGWLRAAIVLGVGFFPPLFVTLAVIWKDAGSLAFLLLCTGLVLRARACRSAGLAWIALLIAFYVSALRIPNLLAVLPLLWLLADILLPSWRSLARRAAVVVSIAAVFTAGIRLLDTRSVVRLPYRAAVPLWDLAMISLARNQFLIPPYAINNPDLDMERLRMITRDYRCDVHDPADFDQVTTDLSYRTLSETEANLLLRYWIRTILKYPREYLQHRAHVTSLLFKDPMLKVGLFMESVPGFNLDVHFEERPGFDSLAAAIQWCVSTPLFSPWVYLVLTVLVFAVSFWVRGDSAAVARVITISGLLYVAPLPVIAPSTDFRYSIWLVAAALVGVLLLTTSTPRPHSGLE